MPSTIRVSASPGFDNTGIQLVLGVGVEVFFLLVSFIFPPISYFLYPYIPARVTGRIILISKRFYCGREREKKKITPQWKEVLEQAECPL